MLQTHLTASLDVPAPTASHPGCFPSDAELLSEYAATRSETAFACLVKRHGDFVYSAALRQVGNHALAQDVAQAVFVILARKAASLGRVTVLAGWLFQAVRFTVRDALKMEARRRRREQEAAAMELINAAGEPDNPWEQLAPWLDEAVAQLSATDQRAVLLRYFEKKDWREVGEALGLKEDTARVRVHRALEKLRAFISRRGVAVSTVALGELLAENSVQAAPAGVTATLNAVATTWATSTLGASLATIALRRWIRVRAAKALLLMLLLVSLGMTLVLLQRTRSERSATASAVRASMTSIDRAFTFDQPNEFMSRVWFRNPEDETFRSVFMDLIHASADWYRVVCTITRNEELRHRAWMLAFGELLVHQPPQRAQVLKRDRATENIYAGHSLLMVKVDGLWKWDWFTPLNSEMRAERWRELREKAAVMRNSTEALRNGGENDLEKVFATLQIEAK